MMRRTKVSILVLCLLVSVAILTACGGPDEKEFSDTTGTLESSAVKGSLDSIQGKYYEEGLKGNYIVFGENGEGVYSQHGTYEITGEGIDLSYDMSDLSMNYSIAASEEDENLIVLQNGDIKLNCTYKDGKAGLHEADTAFTGTYSVDDGTEFVFSEDGSFRQVKPFTYSVEDNKLTETFEDVETVYTWKESKGNILLKIKDETVQTLVPTK